MPDTTVNTTKPNMGFRRLASVEDVKSEQRRGTSNAPYAVESTSHSREGCTLVMYAETMSLTFSEISVTLELDIMGC
jgi:hypothetical protein